VGNVGKKVGKPEAGKATVIDTEAVFGQITHQILQNTRFAARNRPDGTWQTELIQYVSYQSKSQPIVSKKVVCLYLLEQIGLSILKNTGWVL
jgi:hypothetical protein